MSVRHGKHDFFPGNSEFCLDGEWQFAYRAGADASNPGIPETREFSASMIVPGYWDDHWDLLKEMERIDFWSDPKFNPIIELMSSYKRVRRHSALFEGAVGKGRVMICTLNMSKEDPASVYLLYLLLRHAQNWEFRPQNKLSVDFLLGVDSSEIKPVDLSTDQAQDPNARLPQ